MILPAVTFVVPKLVAEVAANSGCSNVLEEEVLLTCESELSDVLEGLALCITGCGRF